MGDERANYIESDVHQATVLNGRDAEQATGVYSGG